jgi:hypothetical protein
VAATTQRGETASTPVGLTTTQQSRVKRGRTAWPGPGLPLVPAVLRALFPDQVLPETLTTAAGLPAHVRWADLDTSVWSAVSDGWEPDDTWISAFSRHVEARTKRLRHEPVVEWPDGLELDDVPLSQVTRNGLGRAGVHTTEQAAHVTFVQTRLTRWFGVRLLLDFASAVEVAPVRVTVPETPRRPLVVDARDVARLGLPGPWPAPGLPLLPAALRARAHGEPGLPAATDETYWSGRDTLAPEHATAVRAFVDALARKETATVLPPEWPAALTRWLPLTSRTRGSLDAAGLLDDPQRLAALTYIEADHRRMRVEALVEVACAAEAALPLIAEHAVPNGPDDALDAAPGWEALARDLRLGGLVPSDGLLAGTAQEAVRARVADIEQETLATALHEILVAACGPAMTDWVPVLTARWGWAGAKPLTREAVQRDFDVSFPRLTGAEKRVEAVLRRTVPFAPALDHALSVAVDAGAPTAAGAVRSAFAADPRIGPWHPASLYRTAALLGRPVTEWPTKAIPAHADTPRTTRAAQPARRSPESETAP